MIYLKKNIIISNRHGNFVCVEYAFPQKRMKYYGTSQVSPPEHTYRMGSPAAATERPDRKEFQYMILKNRDISAIQNIASYSILMKMHEGSVINLNVRTRSLHQNEIIAWQPIRDIQQVKHYSNEYASFLRIFLTLSLHNITMRSKQRCPQLKHQWDLMGLSWSLSLCVPHRHALTTITSSLFTKPKKS